MDDSNHYTITTIDNPYSPFDEFEEWLAFDSSHQYGTLEKLARLSVTSESFTDEENAIEIEHGVDALMSIDIFHMYKKAFPNDNFKDSAISNPIIVPISD